tara:strand:- start:3152 stop:3358 length:207 start_codon:yes stop_codon:yes gene_type:complete
MKDLNFVRHYTPFISNTICPVDEDAMVVYRTTSSETPLSHIHHPIKAGLLNWNSVEQHIGVIFDYAVV